MTTATKLSEAELTTYKKSLEANPNLRVFAERFIAHIDALTAELADANDEKEFAEKELAKWKSGYEEAHRRMDSAGIPSAVGVECNDPKCDCHLVHRVHVTLEQLAEARKQLSQLQRDYRSASDVLDTADSQLTRLAELLGDKRPVTFGEWAADAKELVDQVEAMVKQLADLRAAGDGDEELARVYWAWAYPSHRWEDIGDRAKENALAGVRHVIMPLRLRIAELEKERDELRDLKNGAEGALGWARKAAGIEDGEKRSLQETIAGIVADRDRLAAELATTKQDLADAQQALNRIGHGNAWTPDVCPITGREFFGWIKDEHEQYHPTYGDARTCYTIPVIDAANGNALHDRDLVSRKYDHDLGGWTEYEIQDVRLIDDSRLVDLLEAESELKETKQALAAKEAELTKLREACEKAESHLAKLEPSQAWDVLAASLAQPAAEPVVKESLTTEGDHFGDATKMVDPAEQRFVCPKCGGTKLAGETCRAITKSEPLICEDCGNHCTWAEVAAANAEREGQLARAGRMKSYEEIVRDMQYLGNRLSEVKKQLAAAIQAREAAEQRAAAAEASNAAMRETIKLRLASVSGVIDKGKGLWPEPNYIRDDAWQRFVGEQLCLKQLLETELPDAGAKLLAEVRALRAFVEKIRKIDTNAAHESERFSFVRRLLTELDQALAGQGKQAAQQTEAK